MSIQPAGLWARRLLPFALVALIAVPAADTAQTQPAATAGSPARAIEREDTAAKLHPGLLRRLAEESGPVKAWVFFADKRLDSPAARAAAIERVATTYDSHAVERRRLRGASAPRGGELFDERDVPVNEQYVAAVCSTGARLHVSSSWLNAASVWATRDQLDQIANLPFVARLEAVARARQNRPVDMTNVGRPPLPAETATPTLNYGASTAQLAQIDLLNLHKAGYTGAGVIVGILDSGFRRTHEAFTNPAHALHVVAEYDFVNNDANAGIDPNDPPGQHEHGTMILGCIGAYKPGSLVGGAYDASFILCKTEDTTQEVPAEEDNYVAGLQFIEAHGGDMVTASLGYVDWYTQAQLNGHTAVTTIAVNVATSHGVHCCNAAGNEGHDSDPGTSNLIAPADAYQVITCGAVDGDGVTAYFSSDGPTADGRVKPEVLARGVDTWTVSPYYDQQYATASGTSLSTPLVACAVACLIQARPNWTVDQMRDNLFHAADYYVASHTYDSTFVRGYGIVNAMGPLNDCNHNGVPDVIDIANGTSQDCTGNGIPDECEPDCNHNGKADSCDIASGVSQDCTHNGIPDECEPDCNHNHVADSCDIANGTTPDCNGNGVPDSCDIASGTSRDANHNGIPDECEADCNQNGVPDELDIARGTSRDCNANGLPDECELSGHETVVLQMPDVGGASVVAQDFADAGSPTYSTKAWDDFTITEDAQLSIGQAYFHARNAAGFQYVTFLVEIATAPGGAEAGATVVLSTIGVGSLGSDIVTWDFGGALLPAGTWWLSVEAQGGFATYGQFFWLRANVDHPIGSEHYMHNPGEGFKHGANPTPGSTWYSKRADLAFTISRRKSWDCNGNGVLDLCEPNPAPTIQTPPAATTGYGGESVSLTVVASGTAPLRYRWRKDGLPIPGATAATYTLAPPRMGDAGDYDVVVSSPCGSTTSAKAALTVLPIRPPGTPFAPNPPDGAIDVPLNTSFEWKAVERAALYKVLIRSSPTTPFDFKGNALATRWESTADLQPGTTYNWQILAKNDGGATAGPVWTFTTVNSSGPAANVSSTPTGEGDTSTSGAGESPDTTSGSGNEDSTLQQPPAAGASGLCPTTAAGLITLTLVGLQRTRPGRRSATARRS